MGCSDRWRRSLVDCPDCGARDFAAPEYCQKCGAEMNIDEEPEERSNESSVGSVDDRCGVDVEGWK